MPAKKTKAATEKAPKVKAKPKKLSALDAAAKVLSETGGSMTTKELVEAMAQKKLWESPAGKTPAATLYAAILRELTTKGTASRFQKTEPGKFAATANAGKAEGPKPARLKGARKKGAEPAAEATTPAA